MFYFHPALCVRMHAQWCLTLCDPMDWSWPGSSVHGIFQARQLEWVAVSYCMSHILEVGGKVPKQTACIQVLSPVSRLALDELFSLSAPEFPLFSL